MFYIIVSTILFGAAITLSGAASKHANSNLVAAFTNIIAAIIPVAFVIPVLSKKTVQNQKFGIVLAILAGVVVAFFALAINKSYSVNKVGIVAPAVFGGAILLSTLMSYIIFKEKITQLQLIGLVCLAVGFGVIIYARATGK